MADQNLDDPFTLTSVQQSVTEIPLPNMGEPARPNVDPMSGMTNAEKAEVERLRSEHPDYTANKDHWLFLLKSYEGGPNYVGSDTLHRHQRENGLSYADRLDRAQYQNYCAPLVDFVPEFIFAQPIERTANDSIRPLFSKFEKNVDRAGTDMDSFMRQVAEDARLFGTCWIGEDKLPIPEGQDPKVISVERASELGIDMPYFYIVRPLEVLNWNVDQFGTYLYFKRLETLLIQSGMEFQKIERYTEWTRDVVWVSKVDVTDPQKHKYLGKTTASNAWGEIPFVPVFHKRSKVNKDLGVSFLQDIAYQNKAVFNYTSLIEEFLYRQCFNMLAVQTDTALPTVDRQQGEIGTSNVIEFPVGGTAPQYVSPPVDPAEFIQAERAATIREMYRQAAQDVMGELFGADARSGDASRQQMGHVVPVIAKLADYLQMTEQRALSLWARMMKKDWTGGKVGYRDDYSVTNLMDLILELSSIFNNLMVLSPTFIRAEWIRIIREFDGRIDRETMEKIISEIKAVSDDELKELYQKQSPGDVAAQGDAPSAGNMQQGRNQTALGSDRRRSLQTGDKSSTKERVADANKRTTYRPQKGRA